MRQVMSGHEHCPRKVQNAMTGIYGVGEGTVRKVSFEAIKQVSTNFNRRITQSMFADYNAVTSAIDNKKLPKKYSYIWKLRYIPK